MNIELLKKQYKKLVPGTNVTVANFNMDDLPVSMKLELEGKQVTAKNILATKMKVGLDSVPESLKPFMEAIIELYEKN